MQEPSTSDASHAGMSSILSTEPVHQLPPQVHSDEHPELSERAALVSTSCIGESDLCEDASSRANMCDTAASTPLASEEISPSVSVIVKTVEKFRETLPPNWMPVDDNRGVHLYCLSIKISSAIQREIPITLW